MTTAAMAAGEANVRLLLSIAVVIAATRAVGWVFARGRQPRVLGEITAGILLGPSLLGVIAPGAVDYLFPAPVLGGLRAVAQLGLVLFMFIVGLDLDLDHLRGQGHRAVAISHASIILPFGLGALLAVGLHGSLSAGTTLLPFALFMGIAMAITAFPVLARVLQEARMEHTRIGSLALACAAVDDVTAWCGLAAVVAVVESSGAGDALVTLALSVAFVAVALGVVRPLLARSGSIPLPLAVALALGSAWVTEMIGIHAIFGAFLAGAVMPRTGEGRTQLLERLDLVTTSVLLPVFFAVVGLSTKIGLIDSVHLWLVTGLVIVVAIIGKLGGSAVAARIVGETWRDSVTIGILMNTRGLTEIVILTVGLELGVIDQRLFTVMVIMALVTTFMAGPALRRLVPQPDDRAGDASRGPARPGSARRGTPLP